WGNVPNRKDPDIFQVAPESIETRLETRVTVAPIAPTETEPAPPLALPPAEEAPKRSPLVPRDPGNQLALAAAALVGLGLVATLVPYGRVVTVLFASLGVLIGLFGLIAADRSRRWAAAAAGGSALVLAVVCLAPGWLGIRPWWEAASVDDEPAGQIK